MNNAIEIRGLVKKYPRFQLGPINLIARIREL